jgi:DNA gyrase subunit A
MLKWNLSKISHINSMSHSKSEIIPVSIEDELKHSYLDYAMSVIVSRALPDVRDGLKPVHRRVLYAMHELNNDWNKPYKKSARIVGDVIGKYHPHGDTAVYDTIVRMAQDFSLRYLLVDGQGNFGSVDGDSPAAMRYTEIRMTRLAHELLTDLEKETVDYVPNYDGNEQVPVVLPTRIPNLLVNGTAGIAVGMATNIPPHNLSEVVDACVALIDEPDIEVETLASSYILAPDFPTAAIIHGRAGIMKAYKTGRGHLYMRARTSIEEVDEGGNRQAIIITELPYQVNKARLQERIGELVKEKKVEGISAIRDESDQHGMRVVIELRRGENAEVVLNNLYMHTQLELAFHMNMVALVDGQPRLLNLKELLEIFVQHRREVVTRRTIFDLKKARNRAHILEGLSIALANIDEIIQLIKSSQSSDVAKKALLAKAWKPGFVLNLLSQVEEAEIASSDESQEKGLAKDGLYYLSPEQAQAILDLRLHRLTGLEQDKIIKEYEEILLRIRELLNILKNPEVLVQVVREELLEVKEKYGDERQTEIIEVHSDLTTEDLIPKENLVVTISSAGYAKTQPLSDYEAQRRGGKGKSATRLKEEDFIEHLLVANSHDYLLCFSNKGKVYALKVYQIPQAGRGAKGRPIINLLQLGAGEKINTMLSVPNFESEQAIFMTTARGVVKRVALSQFSSLRTLRASGLIATQLQESDYLVGAALTAGQSEIMLFSNAGKAVRFKETDVRLMGRLARGVRGIALKSRQKVVGLVVVAEKGTILTATANGYGKRTPFEAYRMTNRGAQGVISIAVNEKNGYVVGAIQVEEEDEVLLINNQGGLVRIPANQISLVGRSAQGVRLIRLANDEQLVGLQRAQ